MSECIIARRGGESFKGFTANNSSDYTKFSGPATLPINSDWYTLATISAIGIKRIVAILNEAYNGPPNNHDIILTHEGEEISMALSTSNGVQGIMLGRLVKSGNDILLQVKQTNGTVSPIKVYWFWATGM